MTRIRPSQSLLVYPTQLTAQVSKSLQTTSDMPQVIKSGQKSAQGRWEPYELARFFFFANPRPRFCRHRSSRRTLALGRADRSLGKRLRRNSRMQGPWQRSPGVERPWGRKLVQGYMRDCRTSYLRLLRRAADKVNLQS